MANYKGCFQRHMARSLLKCGFDKVWLDPLKMPEIKQAKTREDVRRLIREGVIVRRWSPKESRQSNYYDIIYGRKKHQATIQPTPTQLLASYYKMHNRKPKQLFDKDGNVIATHRDKYGTRFDLEEVKAELKKKDELIKQKQDSNS